MLSKHEVNRKTCCTNAFEDRIWYGIQLEKETCAAEVGSGSGSGVGGEHCYSTRAVNRTTWKRNALASGA